MQPDYRISIFLLTSPILTERMKEINRFAVLRRLLVGL